MSCPVCGSDEAVSKAEAWDALREVPAKAAEAMDELHALRQMARNLVEFGPSSGDEKTVVVTIRKDLFDELAAAVAR